MVLDAPRSPLREAELPRPELDSGQVRLRVLACGVCRTDLHIRDGELDEPKLPLVLDHEIVATVLEGGTAFEPGTRVGVPWLGWTCGACRYCRSGNENLCDRARFTGYNLDGGYAQEAVADERFCFPIPESYSGPQAAPLLCAGLIGYRSIRRAGDAERIGLYGFGAAEAKGAASFAFTRPGDEEAQVLALRLGTSWASDSTATPRRNSTPRSSSRRWASSSPLRCARFARAVRWSARVST
jgi:propanol-preferring alcohol dehydrogenase